MHARTKLRQVYTAEIGVREASGKNDGQRIQEYLKYTGLSGNYSYCSAFVCWSFSKAGIDNPANAWAPALFPAKRVIWERNGGVGVPPVFPQSGDVFGIYFQELKRIAHCGFVDQWDGTWCITVEANTNDIGSIVSADDPANPIRAGPGEGVYRKKRLIRTIYKVADWVSPSTN